VPYTEAFKAQMVRKLIGPSAVTARALADQVGVPQPTLSKWLREATTVTTMSTSDEKKRQSVVAGPKKWTAAEKLRVVVAAQGLDGPELGELLRREGLHADQLRGWRDAAAGALESAEAAPLAGPGTAAERKQLSEARKRVKELEKELQRTEKALAKTAALVVLKKKMEDIWAAEGDGTDEDNEK